MFCTKRNPLPWLVTPIPIFFKHIGVHLRLILRELYNNYMELLGLKLNV